MNDDANTDILIIPDAGDDDRDKWGNYSYCRYMIMIMIILIA